jgi:hypothetical protein
VISGEELYSTLDGPSIDPGTSLDITCQRWRFEDKNRVNFPPVWEYLGIFRPMNIVRNIMNNIREVLHQYEYENDNEHVIKSFLFVVGMHVKRVST